MEISDALRVSPLARAVDVHAAAETLWQESVRLHGVEDYDAADKMLDRSQALWSPQHVAPVEPYEFVREQWETWEHRREPEWGALNLLNYARRQPTGDKQVFAQYYATEVGRVVPAGQRDPADRLRYLPEDFFYGSQSILDIGCNAGGMLRAAGTGLSWGVGVDSDARLINAANRIAVQDNPRSRLRFYVHDLEADPLELLHDFMPEPRASIGFLLSVCAHVKNWREVIAYCPRLANTLLFEANGHEYEQLGQLRALHRAYVSVEELAGRGAPGIGSRRLLLCREPK